MATLTGDVLSATTFSATLPTALVDAKFSRDFEREADDAAVAWLRSQAIPLTRFADILGRLQREADKRHGEKGEGPMAGYLSTHPVTSERIKRFMGEGR
jgi:predicted Zn-dependent protease